MSFFNQTPNTSGQTTGGIFGTASGSTSGNIFGAATSKPTTTFSFGQPATTSAGSTPSSGSNLFGQTGTTNIFGKPAEQKNDTPNSFLKPSSAAQNSFTPQSSKKIESTTPAGQPPAASIFGASTGTSAAQANKPLFSMGTPASSASASTGITQSTGLFGQPSSQPAPAFGAAPSSTTNLFGAKPSTPAATQATSTSSIFGNTQASAGGASNLFGQAATTSSSQPLTTPAFAGFGQQKKDDKPADTSSNKSLFPSLGTGSAPASSQPAISNIFGQAANTTSSATPLFSNLRGGGTTSAGEPSSTAAPAMSFFGKPALPPSSSTEQQKASSSTSKPATSEATPAFAGFKLGGASTAPTTTATPASSAPTTTPNMFGGLGATTTPASSAATTTSNMFGGLGATTTTAPASSATTASSTAAVVNAPAASNMFNQGQQLTASTSGPQATSQSRLRNKTMDEILTRWASDLTRYTKEFKQHAEQIAKWDQIIVDNSMKIDKLYIKTRTCEKQTMSVEMQLAAVENQQNELESWLDKYEKDVDEMVAKDGPGSQELGGPDQERERTYKLAEKLGDRLDDMDRDLKSMIEEVNSANAELSGGAKVDEPITQIVKILNSHLSQLQAIDQGTSALQAKVAAAQKQAQGMNYMSVNGGLGGDNAATVDGFYRSFMGRR